VWPGPYTEAHRDYFFGRSADQRVIVANLVGAPLTVLFGPSGVGKSSVLGAAVVPALRAQPRAAVVLFSEWHAGFLPALKARAAEAVAGVTGRNPEVDPGLPLDDFLAELGGAVAGSILLVFDQFEQYFVLHPNAEVEFEEELASTINRPDVEANIILVLREDWLARLDRFRAGVPDILGNLVGLRHLTAAAAEEAIRKPLQVYRERFPATARPVDIEDALVERLLMEARPDIPYLDEPAGIGHVRSQAPEDRIDTSLLQLVLMRLWSDERDSVMRLRTLEEAGGTRAIVRGYVDGVMQGLSEEAQEAAARMFRFLVTPTGVKIAHTADDLIDFGSRPGEGLATDLEPAAIRSVLDVLDRGRILRHLNEPDRYEIFHDVLARAVLDWRRRREDDRLAREAHAAWVESRAWGSLRLVGTGKAYPLRGSVVTVGRSVEYWQNDVDLRAQLVSRVHLLLFRNGLVYDMRSLNGTTVNAAPLGYGRPRPLDSGDIVAVAGVSFGFDRIEYPTVEDPRARIEPPIEDRPPLSGWAFLIDGAAKTVRPLTADRYAILVDERQQRLILEEEAAGRRLVVRRQDNDVKLTNESETPLVMIVREQYTVKKPSGDTEVLVGRGYVEHPVPPGEEMEVPNIATWRFGEIPFQIVQPEMPEPEA
jgi:hypothetical protein